MMNHTPSAKRVSPLANCWEIAWVMTGCWDPLFARFLCSQLSREFLVQSVFRRIHKIAKKRLLGSTRSSVLLSTWNNSAPTGWIFMTFDIWIFSEILSRKFKFH